MRKPVWRVSSPLCLYSCSTLSLTPRTPPRPCWSLRAPVSCILGTLTCRTQKVGILFVRWSSFVDFSSNRYGNNGLAFTLDVSLDSLPADEGDEEFSDDQLLRLPPVGPPSWDSNVVCIQPTRNHSRPEGHEESEEKQHNGNNVSSDSILSNTVQYYFPPLCYIFINTFFLRVIPTSSPQQLKLKAHL